MAFLAIFLYIFVGSILAGLIVANFGWLGYLIFIVPFFIGAMQMGRWAYKYNHK